MSAASEPITLARFSAAITELPLSSLFAKGAEIRNSINHLDLSNTELKSYADAGDQDCADALEENVGVIARMRIRLELLMVEVERRGSNWNETSDMTSDREPVHIGSEAQLWDSETTTLVDRSDEHTQQMRHPTAINVRLEEQRPAQERRLEDVQPSPSAEQEDHTTETNGLYI